MNSKLSKLLFVISLLVSTHAAYAAESEPKDLIANWTGLYEEGTQEAGAKIFEQAIAEATPLKDEDPIKASRLFFKAAEFCRDLNDVRHAITLFDLAIEANPEEPHYRRVYGDYLIGYRGLEEQAWAQLYEARRLAETYPGKVDDDFRKTLDRSIHIFRRDTTDGVLTFERNRSDGALLFENENLTLTGGFDTIYKKVAKDPLDLSTDYFRGLDFYATQGYLGGLRNNDINEFERKLERQIEASETLASILLRTPNANLPAIRLSYLNISTIGSTLNFDGIDDPFDQIDDSVFLEAEKTFIIKNDLFLEGDIALQYLNEQTRSELYDIEDSFLYLTSGANLRKEWGTRDGIVRLNVGGTYSRDLFDFEAAPIHSQLISLRNSSFFEDPLDNDSRQRFRGRRSSSQEIGLIRQERRYEASYPTVKEENWRFFVSNEELGLANGMWDIYTTYTYRERNLSDGIGEGSYSIHEFSIEPIWVPVFELYENDFISGWEFVTVGFPIKINTDEGPYDRALGGVTFKGQYVVFPQKLTLGISVGLEYAHYTEADQEDLGGFIRLSIF